MTTGARTRAAVFDLRGGAGSAPRFQQWSPRRQDLLVTPAPVGGIPPRVLAGIERDRLVADRALERSTVGDRGEPRGAAIRAEPAGESPLFPLVFRHPGGMVTLDELSAENRYRPAAQENAAVRHSDADDAAAPGRLESDQRGLAQPGGPERAQAAVRRTGDRVLVDAAGGSEVARDEIEPGRARRRRDDDAARRPAGRRERREPRLDAAQAIFRVELDQEVESIAADGQRLGAEGLEQAGRRLLRARRARPGSRARSPRPGAPPRGRRSSCGTRAWPRRARGPLPRACGRRRAWRGRRGPPRRPA